MKNNINTDYDLIIIGAGPGGFTSAIYACRAELKVLLINGGPPGGKMVKTYDIENYPGFDKILGPDLSLAMDRQVRKLGAEYEATKVKNIEIATDGNNKIITGENGKIWLTKAVIIATGTVENELLVDGAKRLYGHGVSYCAVCDGAFFRNKDIVVVGGGDSAIEEAVYLTKFVRKLYLVHRRNEFRASKGALTIAQNNNKIEWLLNYVVKEVIGKNSLEQVVIEHTVTKEQQVIDASAIFPYIGSTPISNFVKDLKICDENGYIITNEIMHTSVLGIFAIGDVRQTVLRQIATAVGDGAIAAQEAIKYLDQLKL